MRMGNYALTFSLLLRDLPVSVDVLGICPDREESVMEMAERALRTVDILLTTGGTSAGEKDIVTDALASAGDGWIHRGLRLRPGHTTAIGRIQGKPVIALPGVIIAATSGFYALLIPILEHLLDLQRDTLLPRIPSQLDSDLKKRNALSFQPVKITHKNSGFLASLVGGGAGLISRLVKSNGFIMVPPGAEFKKDEKVEVVLYSPRDMTRIGEVTS
jgi:molybdenum cofactor synthesis domain-containing protein